MKYLGIALVVVLIGCSKNTDTITPQRKEIIEAVYASGSLHPDNEYKVFATVSGILSGKMVSEGDSVTKGKVLFTIDSRDPALRQQLADETLRYARTNAADNSAQVGELQNNIENARAKFTSDSLVYERTALLFQQGAATRAEFDRTQTLMQASKALYQQAQNRYNSVREQLRNQLQSAERQYQLSVTSKGNYSVNSLLDGRVFAVYKEVGEMVNAQQPIALLGSTHQFHLHLIIDARDVVKVGAGMDVVYSVDAMPDSVFHARVTKIYPVLENETQSFRVDADCIGLPPIPFAGTQIQANIIVSKKPNALVIPRSYVQQGNMVYVKDGSSIQQVKVKTGIVNLEYAEILDGITEQSQLTKKASK